MSAQQRNAPIDWRPLDDRLRALAADNVPTRCIAAELGVSSKSVWRRMRQLGLPLPRPRHAVDWSAIDPRLRAMIEEQGMDRRAAADALGMAFPTVSKRITHLGLGPRKAQARGVAVSSEELIQRACRASGLPRRAIIGGHRSRQRERVQARHAIAHVLHEQRPNLSMNQIARVIGANCHTTVLSALRRAERLLASGDKDFTALVEFVRSGDGTVPRRWIDRGPAQGGVSGCERIAALVDRIDRDGFDAANDDGRDVMTSSQIDGREGPRLTEDELAARREALRRERAEREARWLAAERARYGMTRQTRAAALSEQFA
jgi:DNA-binding Lrp family transcriptional regulator